MRRFLLLAVVPVAFALPLTAVAAGFGGGGPGYGPGGPGYGPGGPGYGRGGPGYGSGGPGYGRGGPGYGPGGPGYGGGYPGYGRGGRGYGPGGPGYGPGYPGYGGGYPGWLKTQGVIEYPLLLEDGGLCKSAKTNHADVFSHGCKWWIRRLFNIKTFLPTVFYIAKRLRQGLH